MEFTIKDGKLTISIDLKMLATATELNPALQQYCEMDGRWSSPQVLDLEGFAEDCVRELKREDDTGLTLAHKMIDAAALAAIEAGSDHPSGTHHRPTGLTCGRHDRLSVERPTGPHGSLECGWYDRHSG